MVSTLGSYRVQYSEAATSKATSLARDTRALFPESGVIAIKDKREWPPSREQLGTSWVVTVCVDSIATARLSMIQQEIELAQISLEQKNKFAVKYDMIYFYRSMVTFINEQIVKRLLQVSHTRRA